MPERERELLGSELTLRLDKDNDKWWDRYLVLVARVITEMTECTIARLWPFDRSQGSLFVVHIICSSFRSWTALPIIHSLSDHIYS